MLFMGLFINEKYPLNEFQSEHSKGQDIHIFCKEDNLYNLAGLEMVVCIYSLTATQTT